ncbi:neuroblast differentiation-associated protein AHNAK-like [Corythoichthys intestinalis]|uniref:neuroblast differentiation-associated protein AHNAK-like n=1 Tax=Corythoichthys intestinalis TaxID=161448 RepID=UPI0025A67521|nr:neuroblast differentiation-associated protein AHNAK-like [Corythoichthys intestinalis]
MCDCFHLAFPNWHGAPSGTGAGRRLRAPDLGSEDHSACEETSHFTEGERPRPQGSSPVEEHPETEKYSDSDKEEDDLHYKKGRGKKAKKSSFGCGFDRRSTSKMSKLKEAYSPESGMIVKTAKDGGAEGLVYAGGGKEGIFIKEVVPESPASKSLQLKEGDQLLSATVYFDNVSYQDAIQILEHAQAYKVKLCLKRKPNTTETEPLAESDIIPEDETFTPEMREHGKSKRRGDARISWPKFPSLGRGKKSRFARSHSSSEADEQRKLELSPPTSDTESPIKTQDALKGKKRHKMKLPSLTKRGRISSSEDQDTDAPTTGTQEAAELLSPEGLQSPVGGRPDVHSIEEMTVEEGFDSRVTKPLAIQHKVELIAIDSALKTTDLTVALTGKESPTGPLSPDGKKKKKERSELKMKMLGKDKSQKKEAKAKSPKRLKTLGASLEIADQIIVKGDQPEHATQIEQKSPLKGKAKKRTLLPKREDIEIPGMEDASVRTKVKGHHDELQETVQLSIDVDSVKEAVSKLPGYKLPKVDMCGVPIPEEITVIDANAQRISVKTPTKVVDSRTKQQAPISKAEDTSTPELSKTLFKLPKVTPDDLTSEEVLTVTRLDQTTQETTQEGEYDKKSKTTKIVLPSVGFSKSDFKIPDIGMYLPKPNILGPKDDEMKGERTIFLQEADAKMHEAETSAVTVTSTGELEYIDSAESPVEKELDRKASPFQMPKFELSLPKLIGPDIDLSLSKTDGKAKSPDAPQLGAYKNIPEEKQAVDIAASPTDQEAKGRRFKLPQFDFTVPEITGPQLNVNFFKKDTDGKKLEQEFVAQLPETSQVDLRPGKAELDGQEGVKTPKVEEPDDEFKSTKKDVRVNLKDTTIDIKIPDTPKMDAKIDIEKPELQMQALKFDVKHREKFQNLPVNAGEVNIGIAEAKFEVPEIDTEPLYAEIEHKGGKFKMPKFGISMPKVKGPEIDFNIAKADVKILHEDKKELLVEGDIKTAKIDVAAKATSSPTKLWRPTFKLPKFGVVSPSISVEVPEGDKDVKIDGKIPEEVLAVSIEPPSIDTDQPSVEMTMTQDERDKKGSKFKLPSLGFSAPEIKGPSIDLSIPKKSSNEYKGEIHLSGPELKETTDTVEIKSPQIEIEKGNIQGSPSKLKLPSVKFPKFTLTRQSSKESEAEIVGRDDDIPVPEGNLEVIQPNVEIQPSAVDVKIDVQDSKIKMPKFGISLPKVKGPVIDLTLSEKDGKIRLPEAEVELPNVDIKLLSAEEEMEAPKIGVQPGNVEGTPSKFKLPKVKFPKLSLTQQSSKESEVEIGLPEGKIELTSPEVEFQKPEVDVSIDGKESKLKMPKFGISMPKVKGPDIDISVSKKDREIKLPSAKVEIEAPKIEAQPGSLEGSPSKIKLPKVKFPKFSLTKQSSKESEGEIGPPDVCTPEGKMEITSPQIEFQPPEVDTSIDGKENKIKLPKFGISIPKVKGPDIDLSLSRKDGEIQLPGAEVELLDVDINLPSAKVESKAPKIEAQLGSAEGSPSKIKLPTVTFPKISFAKQSSQESEVELGLQNVEVSIPEGKVEITSPEVAFKPSEVDDSIEGRERKFKMPKFGISMPKMKGPEIDISLSKKEGDTRLPEAEVELMDVDIKLPSAKVEIETTKVEAQPGSVDGSPSKFKLPTFKVPKLGVALPQVSMELDKDNKIDEADAKSPDLEVDAELPDADTNVDIKMKRSKFSFPKFSLTKQSSKESGVEIGLPDIDVSTSEGKVEITSPKLDFQPAEVDVNIDGKESKFKMPKFGISMPKVKGPDIDLSLSKKDGDFKLPEAEVDLPDVEMKLPSAKVEIEAPKIEAQQGSVEGSPSKFKLPTISFPKFSLTKQSSKEAEVEFGLPEGKMEITSPEVEFQTPAVDASIDGKESKFKMPKFGISMPKVKGPDIDINLSKKDGEFKLPEAEIEVSDVEIKLPSAEVEIQPPKIEAQPGNVEESPSKFKLPTISFPKFSLSKQSSKESEVEIGLPNVDVSVPEGKVGITAPGVQIETPEVDVNIDGKESKFKMPKFGISMPKVKGPEIDISLSKKDGEIQLPDAEIELPDVDINLPSAKVEIEAPTTEAQPGSVDGSPSKFKLPTFKVPKLAVALPQVSVELDKDTKIDEADVKSPDLKVDADLLDADTNVDIKMKRSKFSFPKFSLTKQSSKEPEVEIGLPEGKMEITSPEIEFQPPEVDVSIDGKDSNFKMPKFGISMPKVKSPDIDISLSKKDGAIKLPDAEVDLPDVDIKLPSAKVEIEAPKIEAQQGSVEGSPSKFKLPSISFPKFSLTKQSSKEAEVEIGLPEGKMEITSPEIEFQPPEVDVSIDGKDSKFKMPKFGMSMPKVKSPDIDISLSKKDGAIKLPDAEVDLPDVDMKLPSAKVEIEAPKIEAQQGSVEGSPSKFKLPSISFPKFSLTKQSSKEAEVEIGLPEGKMEITSPEIEFQPPEVDVSIDGKDSKFKMPKFGMSMPKVKSPDIDISLSKKDGAIKLPDAEVDLPDVDMKLPSAKVEIEAPKIEAQQGSVEGSPSKFKLPSISFPKFSLTKQSSKEAEVEIGLPEGKMEITSPEIEFQPLEVDVSIDGKDSKFKMPKFGISIPKVKSPDIDISLSKKDGAIKLPDAEVDLPDVDMKLPSAAVEIEAAKIEAQQGSVEGSPSKFKLPSISFHKFSLTKQSSKEAEVEIGLPEGKMEITSPEIEFQPPEVDVSIDGKDSKFKMPKFGISMPKVKGPDIDISLSKKDGAIKLPEAEVDLPDVDIKLPSAKIEIEAPKTEAQQGSVEGSPSKCKLPSISFPKFSLTKQSSKEAEVEIGIPEGKMEITSPEIEFQPPEVDVSIDGKDSKFKMPKFGISMPKVKGPDIDIRLSKKDGAIKLPEAEVDLPDVDIKLPSAKVEIEAPKIEEQQGSVEGSPSKFKLPSISFPKFSLTKQSSKEAEVEIGLPEGKMEITSPEIEFQPPEVDVSIDGQDSKFKMPKFGISMPKVKGPDIDISLSKKDGAIKLPEAEVDLPDVDIKLPSAKVEIEAPKIEEQQGSVEGSPSKFKLPSISFPKFSLTKQSSKEADVEIGLPEGKMDITSPEVEFQTPAVDVTIDGKASKFRMPKFGISMSKVKGPDIDISLSKKDGAIKLPDAEVDLPDVDMRLPSAKVEIEAPKIEAQQGSVEGSPSKFKLPSISFPKFSLTKQSSKEAEVEIGLPEGKMEITSPEIEFQTPEVDVSIDGKDSKFKMPKFGISMPKVKGPDIDISLSKKDGAIELPEAEVDLTDVDIELPSAKVEIEAPKIGAQQSSVEGSPSKFKLPTISFPKFSLTKQSSKEAEVEISLPEGKMKITSPEVEFQTPAVDVTIDGKESKLKMPGFDISMPKVKGPDIDINLSKKDGDFKLPEAEVEVPDVEMKLPSAEVEIQPPKIEAQRVNIEGSPSKFKLPTISFPKFSLSKQSSKESEVEIGLPNVDVCVPEGKVGITVAGVEIETPGVDVNIDSKESKFKMPKFGISMPKVKGPEIDISLSKKDGEIQLPDAEIELPDVNINLPSAKVEIEAPKIEEKPGSVDGSPSKFKMPTFKVPKLAVALPQVSVELDKDTKIDEADVKSPDIKIDADLPDADTNVDFKLKRSKFSFPKFSLTKQSSKESEVEIGLPDVDVSIPEGKMEITSPKMDLQPPDIDVNIDGKESKFKMPKFGISMPKVRGPDIDISLSKKDGEFKLPEAEVELTGVEMKLPSAKVEIETPKIEAQQSSVEGSPSKFKLPTISFPKLSLTKQSSKETDVDIDLPEGKMEITSPKMDFHPAEVDVSIDGKESKFKMPRFGISMPKVKGPDIDISLSKKDGEFKLPEAEADLPDVDIKIPSAKVEIEAPKIEAQPGSVEGSPSKFKLPSISFPKFSLTKQSSKEAEVEIGLPEGKMEITSPEIEFQPPEVNVSIDGKESKFKMPKFGISMPKVKGPDIDISLSKKDEAIKLPEAEVDLPNVDIKLPSAEVEIEASKIEAGSPSKYKLPTIRMPKLGVSLPQVNVELDKDINVDERDVKSPGLKIEAEPPNADTNVDVKMKRSRFSFPKFSLTKQKGKESQVEIGIQDVDISATEGKMEITSSEVQFQSPEFDVSLDGKEGEFKMPKFGISMPQMKGPDININLSNRDREISLPEAEVELPDVNIKLPSAKVEIEAPKIEAQPRSVEGSPSKFKLPTISFPKFSLSKQSSKESEVQIGLPDVDVSIPEGKVGITGPEVEFETREVDINIDGKESKFQMSKFDISMPKMKGPDIDINLSKKDGEIRLPEAGVDLPDVDIKLPSAQVETEGASIEAKPQSVEGSPSKFKLPTFKLPKLGVALPQVSVESEKDIKVDDDDLKSPELKVEAELPENDTNIDVKMKRSRFSFPKFSLTKQSNKESEVEIGLPHVVSIPKTKMEITSPELDHQTPEVDVSMDGQESKFKMPQFGISMPKMKGPDIDINLSKKDGKFKLPETKVDLPDVDMKLSSANVEIEAPKVEAKSGSVEGSPSKFKLPTISFPKFSLPKQSSKESEIEIGLPDVDISIPDVDVSIPKGNVVITSPEVDFQTPEVDINIDGKESKFKMPKFGISMPKVKGPDVDISLSKKDSEIQLPEAEVELPDVDIKLPSAKVEIEAPSTEAQPGSVDGSPSKFKLPTFKLPKLGVALPQVSVELEKDVKGEHADLKSPELLVETNVPDFDTNVDVKMKRSKFSFPKFSLTKQSSKESEVEIGIPDVDVSVPEGNVEISSPQVEFQPPEGDVRIDGQESKFKMPKFGLPMPKVKGPEIDISLSKTDGEIKLPETKVELPDVDIKLPSANVEIETPKIEAKSGRVDGSPSKFKLPTISFPKFSLTKQSIKDADVEVGLPEGKLEITSREVAFKTPEVDVNIDGQESEFKMPKLGISGQKVKTPDIDINLSKKDGGITLPEDEMNVPDVGIKLPSAQVEIEGASIEAKPGSVEGSPSKFKLPTIKLPKLGVALPQVNVELDKDIKVDDADLKLPELKVEADLPDTDTNIEVKMKRSRFSFPKFSLTKQSSKVSEVDIGLSEGKTEMTSPEVAFQTPEVDVSIDAQESKFKMPRFGVSVEKMTGPDIDISLSKKDGETKLPEPQVELQDVDIKLPSAKVETEPPKIEVEPKSAKGSPSKYKLPTISFPKFSLTKQSSKETEVECGIPDVNASIPEGKLEITSPEVEFQTPDVDVNIDVQESKFKMPKFGISMPKVKGPEIDTNLSKKDVEIRLPEAEVELTDVEIKLPSAQVEIEGHKIEAQPSSVAGSPSKIKLPTVKFPKLGISKPKYSVEIPDTDNKIVDSDVKFGVPEQEGTVKVTTPNVDMGNISVDFESTELEGSGIKFKMPKFGVSLPKVKGSVTDVSLSKTDKRIEDITLTEAEVELKDVPSMKVETDTPKIEGSVTTSPSKFKLPTVKFPKISLSKQSTNEISLPNVDVSIPEAKVEISPPQVEFQPSEKHDEPESTIKMPEVDISPPKVKGHDNTALSKRVGEFTLPDVEMKQPSANVELEGAKIETQAGSPSKFKLPSFKLPKFGGSPSKIHADVANIDQDIETDGIKLEIPDDEPKLVAPTASTEPEGVSLKVTREGGIEGPGIKLLPDVDAKIKLPDIEHLNSISGLELPKAEAEVKLSKGPENNVVSPVSPSKFKLPSFKMPRLTLSPQKPEGQSVSLDTEHKVSQLEMKAELNGDAQSPQATLTSTSVVLRNLEADLDVAKIERVEEHSDAAKEVKDTNDKQTKQKATKSPERTGWFRFPTFGLSSPVESAKTPPGVDQKDQMSPTREREEDMSPTSSVQSSDVFADISSTVTSEYVSLPSSSPTKVMVKYSDQNLPPDLSETNVVMSTARSELITVEPNLPEKITLLSTEVSSSSEETLRLASGKIHVFTSKQAGPESHHTKLLSTVQSTGEASQMSSSWKVESSQSSVRTVSQKRIVRETSRESTETFVITKQITKTFDPAEFFSENETASSIQRLRESVHSEKMKFFDGAEK